MVSREIGGKQFQELRQSFSSQLPGRVSEMTEVWRLLQNSWNTEAADHLLQSAHKIGGASLSLGYTRIGMAAQAIETALQEIKSDSSLEGDRFIKAKQIIAQKMVTIQIAVTRENPESPLIAARSSKESINAVPSMQDSRASRTIFLVEEDRGLSQEIAKQIGYFGYNVREFSSLIEMEKALQHAPPAALLIDINFPEGETAGTDLFLNLRNELPAEINIIFISAQDDMKIRLKAVRAGGRAYFPKPLNIGALIEMLDRLMMVEDVLPYRILIVDDDAVQAAVNALHLKRAGMETFILNDPIEIIQVVQDTNPDLILLDMYMPQCSGMDLAVIIRQIDLFVSIPIVYLSAEMDREKQLKAVGLGGDDFLTKPIKPEHLISAVASRVDRYRQLRFLMVRDSLTGLLNHTTLKERYSQEINRAIRQNKPLAYAMIDLDNFKQINDTFGHASGDRVLKSLASMLSNRLRSSDIIGRYGGEEFAVVLPNTTQDEAVKVMEEICSAFSHIRHFAGGNEFSVTFSCGVAAYPECGTPTVLAEMADQALYSAKRIGKNCVTRGKIINADQV